MSSETQSAETDQSLEKLLSSIYGLVAYLDCDCNFIKVNKAYAEADGHEPSFFIGKNHFELYPHAENEAIFRRVIKSGEPYIAHAKPFEYPDEPDRGVTYWDWKLTPVHNADNEIDGLLLTLIDVTSHVKADNARHQIEQSFHTLFNNTADAIYILDMNGHIVECNEAAYRDLGYSRAELLRMDAKDLKTPLEREQFAAKIGVLLKEGHLLTDSCHVARDGRHIPVEINSRLIEFQGTPAILSTVRDISKRVDNEHALRDSEANIRALLDATTESVSLTERDHTVTFINETGAKRLRTTPADMLGKDIFSFIPEQLREPRKKHFQRVIYSGQPVTLDDSRGGFYFSSSIYPVLNDEGAVERVAVFAKDVTEEHRLQATEILLRDLGSRYFAKVCFGHPSPSKQQKLHATVYACGAPTVLSTLRNHLFAALHNFLTDSTPT
ncbi:PAS domain S-box protein [Candidatus Reidiella endopervernicosa]|uniref:PAS domain S-box protein n=1 Tax=Candidatus Reidiella endopervernicosa TaxID=2738883 RepID=A0A6N0HTL5_9GAMM|nr:PAS domain S-box protein [Candidatus Reidiella endopervernicosa]QKQ25521.1 PAS domain S-box protein [Candidatus Reidiella endopervernicosa]